MSSIAVVQARALLQTHQTNDKRAAIELIHSGNID